MNIEKEQFEGQKDLIGKFLKENPKEKLASELLLDVKDYVAAQEKLESFGKKFLGYKDLKSSKEEIVSLASWNQRATEFLAKHEHDKELVQSFWSNYKAIFDSFSNDTKSRDGIIRGIVGQASVYHILSHSGFRPEVSTPQEDVFEKIDLKISLGRKDIAIQVKQRHDVNEPLVVNAQEVRHPGVVLKGINKDVYFSSHDIEEMMSLQENCKEKSRRERKEIEAFYIVIPSGQCDPDTGKPSPEFLRKAKSKIKSLVKR